MSKFLNSSFIFFWVEKFGSFRFFERCKNRNVPNEREKKKISKMLSVGLFFFCFCFPCQTAIKVSTFFRTRHYILLLTITTTAFGQIPLNPGVDTTDKELKAVYTLWTNYLISKPNKDNIKNSPYWAESEKIKYPKVDQLLNAINTETPTYSMGYPTILYMKSQNGFIEIKTLFGWSDSLKNIYALCITSVFAKKENGEYKLYNALTVNSYNWQIQKIGSLTFHFPLTHIFDKAKATILISSIDSLRKQWKLNSAPIDYYFADTYEEIQHLRGLDFAIGMGNKDKPSGISDQETNTVFAGGLGENYFHEVVHIYLNRLFPNSSLVEGLAVFYGGSIGHDLKWHLTRLNDYLNQHPEINLNDFEDFWYMDNFTNPNSTIQGLLCYLAYKNGGLDKLKQLMSYDDTIVAIEKEFGIKKDELNKFFREQINLNKN
ncbi:MAG: hypothetical protein A3H98_14355 [Bacteroidetes bacterium RIFCSPLOWO2_02_FULL_36_8]|nr:MAG: hypothetical protein A3H98_14355 [Bacteroidetes bacterium RIFCSPLOWO2_02_FULL_36_8]OFY71879.1 MAG: hypothetical protein A3G23_04965 [Bacteroidetes bacterium RIFCSPLOWO2_12_FULL_37_12]